MADGTTAGKQAALGKAGAKAIPKVSAKEGKIDITCPGGNPLGMAIRATDDSIVITIRYGKGCEKINFFGIEPGQPTTKGGGPGCP